MNAKFEKWWGEKAGVEQTDVYLLVKESCQSSWQAAIQSLEVTTELEDTLRDILEVRGFKLCIRDAEIVLTAVLSALKEQVK